MALPFLKDRSYQGIVMRSRPTYMGDWNWTSLVLGRHQSLVGVCEREKKNPDGSPLLISRYRERSNLRKDAIFYNKINERFKLTSRTFGDKWRAREFVILG